MVLNGFFVSNVDTLGIWIQDKSDIWMVQFSNGHFKTRYFVECWGDFQNVDKNAFAMFIFTWIQITVRTGNRNMFRFWMAEHVLSWSGPFKIQTMASLGGFVCNFSINANAAFLKFRFWMVGKLWMDHRYEWFRMLQFQTIQNPNLKRSVFKWIQNSNVRNSSLDCSQVFKCFRYLDVRFRMPTELKKVSFTWTILILRKNQINGPLSIKQSALNGGH